MITLAPGRVTLGQWRAIYQGDAAELDPACHEPVAAGAASLRRILARGEPVYGINTGFGKLASVRIGADALEQLQLNIVLSHAAGVGAPMPDAVLRLMMALKLCKPRRKAHRGCRLETVGPIGSDFWLVDVTPVIPVQGSVGASGDLAPLAHMAAALLGGGEPSSLMGVSSSGGRGPHRRPGWRPS